MRRFLVLLLMSATLLAAAPGFAQKAPAAPAPSDALQTALALEEAFVAVAAAVVPAVVTIEVDGAVSDGPTSGGLSPFSGMGSGFVIAANGTILTNHHVVANAIGIDVVFVDGSRHKADLVASDEASDVAVIRLLDPPDSLPVAILGDSDGVRVGQFAIAIGAPLGFDSSFTVGHVSALGRNTIGRIGGRTMPGFEKLKYQDFLQVDTPINQGNSGGPLVDLHGRVIGINTAVAGGGGVGLGFSIPINMAQRIADQLIADGRVRRGYLGVQMDDINPEEAEVFGLQKTRGARIEAVVPDSPAARATLLPEDLVTRFNGREIDNARDLINAVADAPIGNKVTMTVFRGNGGNDPQTMKLSVVLDEYDEERSAAASKALRPEVPEYERGGRFGLVLESATKRRNRALKRSAKAGGVVVEACEPDSPAWDAGLRAGDVLLQVGREAVSTPADVYDRLEASTRPFVPLRVERAGEELSQSIAVPGPR